MRQTGDTPAVHIEGMVEREESMSLQELEKEAGFQSLTELTTQLKRVMVPVEPSVAFVRSLGKELVEASRRRQKTTRRLRRGLLVGAAALGSVASVAGVVVTVLVLRRRSQAHTGSIPS